MGQGQSGKFVSLLETLLELNFHILTISAYFVTLQYQNSRL